jgi:hypothetical protein
MTKIEFLYFTSCPSHQNALHNLKEVIERLDLDAELTMIEVESPEAAASIGFFGSPSIKINGVDLERRVGPASFNCRLYQTAGKMTGVPTKEFIEEKLVELSNNRGRDLLRLARVTR